MVWDQAGSEMRYREDLTIRKNDFLMCDCIAKGSEAGFWIESVKRVFRWCEDEDGGK
jgi:hypothetical protein